VTSVHREASNQVARNSTIRDHIREIRERDGIHPLAPMIVEPTHNTNDGEKIMPVGRVKYFAEIDHEYIGGVHFSGGALILALILSCK
jgi:hypothetical protein